MLIVCFRHIFIYYRGSKVSDYSPFLQGFRQEIMVQDHSRHMPQKDTACPARKHLLPFRPIRLTFPGDIYCLSGRLGSGCSSTPSAHLVSAQRQAGGRPHAEQRNQQSLNGMHNENKQHSIGLPDTIKHENRLHSKVPRTRPIRRRDQHGKRAHHKSHQSSQRTQARREVETKESQIEMQVITRPDTYRINKKKQRTLHLTNRKQTTLQVRNKRLRLRKKLKTPRNQPHTKHSKQPTSSCHNPTRSSETAKQTARRNTRVTEKIQKDRHLRQKRQQRKQQNKHRVDNPLRNNRPHTTTEIRPLITLQHTTTQHLAHTRHNQAAGITQENSMRTSGKTRPLAGRNKHLTPPHSTQHLRQNTKRQRQKHPRPRHLMRNSIRQLLPTNTTIHPPQYACRQSQRHTNFDKLSYPLHVPNELFFISLPCKSTKN